MTGPDSRIDLVAALPGQQRLLADLFVLYAQDFSDLLPVQQDRVERYLSTELPLYWSEPGRYPFLVTIEGSAAGFALVRRGSRVSGDEDVWDMADFFIVRKHRGRGAGTRIAHEVWRRFPGAWEIRVMESNVPALRFWAHAIESFLGSVALGSRFEKDSLTWRLLSFSASESCFPSHSAD